MSSVIVRNSGDIGESIYQYKGWKQDKRTERKTDKRTSRFSAEMVQVSIDQKPVSR
jgi:hypothetical protein